MKYKIALGQISPRLGDVAANLKKYREYIDQAIDQGVELLVFPELSLTGYTLKDMVPVAAQRLDEPIIAELIDASHELSLVIGFVEESSDYRYYNSSAYLEGGKVVHIHRKVYLPTYGMFDEQRYFAWGETIRSFDCKLGRTAMLICEDFWHPSAVYIASQDGGDVLIGISCSPGRGVSTDEKLYSSKAWETLNKMYAQFFCQYVIFVNRVGYEDGVNFWGGSEIVDPDGETVLKAKYFDEDLAVGEIDTDRIRRSRILNPLLRDEKLDLTVRELQRIQKRRYK